MLESALDDAVLAGDIATIDVPDTARAILAYVQGLIMFAKLHDRPALLDELSEHALKLLLSSGDERRHGDERERRSHSPA